MQTKNHLPKSIFFHGATEISRGASFCVPVAKDSDLQAESIQVDAVANI